MNDDVDRISAEIDRLALQTTDPVPMQLFIERGKLQKRMQMWKWGGGAIAILAGIVAFVVLFAKMTTAFRKPAPSQLWCFF